MEAELDSALDYSKNHKSGLQTDNKRNGYSTKPLKNQKTAEAASLPSQLYFVSICSIAQNSAVYKMLYLLHKEIKKEK